MDVSMTSDPNESQATQLLNDLLDNGTASSRRSQGRSPGLNSRSVHSNEISSDSSRHSNTLPQYHFHGLATTQTQSQHCEDSEEPNEGSQKENIGTSRTSKDPGQHHASPPRQGSPHPSSSKNQQDTAFHGDNRSSTVSGQKRPSNRNAPTATVTFQSRAQKPSSSLTRLATHSPLKPMSHFNSRRLHSRSDSQDSFACDPDNKPEEQYLARSEKFAVPLSELGKHSSPIRAPSNFTASSYYKERSPPSGRILVEATPSHSGSSQRDENPNLSQQLEATQLVDEHGEVVQRRDDTTTTDKDGNGSGYESSEPSSSYHRLLDGDRGSEHQIQATQPSTQVEDSTTGHFSEDAIPWSNLRSAPHPSVSSAPQSLLSMVPAENRWRYRQYLQSGSGAQESGRIIPPAFGQTSDSRDRRTPSSFPASTTGRSFPPGNTIRNMPHGPRPPSPVRLHMDVVPDSEPVAHKEVLQTSEAAVLHTVTNPAHQTKHTMTRYSDMDLDFPESNLKEEEEEEEEVPLASLAKQVKNPATNVLIDMPPPKKMPAKGKVAAAPPGMKPVSNPAKPQGGARSWEITVVPSSVPEQDHSSEHHVGTKFKKPPLSKSKAAPARTQPRRGSRSGPAASKSRAPNQEPEVVSESEPEPRMQSTSRDGTEPVDDEFMEDDDGFRKRKRAPKVERNTRGASRRGKRKLSPAPRQSKRLRSALSTTSKTTFEEPTRVFALWKQDCHYYPGVVHSANTDSEYLVKFDDDTESWVKLDQLRLLELRVGDDVLIPNCYRPSRVVNIDGQDDGEVQVYVEEEVKTMQISSLRIANKTALYDWKDRLPDPQSIISIVKPVKPHLSPSPSKMSMLSLPLVRDGTKKVLARTGLIVTLTASNGKWEKEKEKVMSAVKRSGGIVIDDLTTILRMDGRHLQNGNAWIIKKTDVEWIGDEEIERLFLVADEPNQKPKFLMALALGIPCLVTEWLYESVKSGTEKEWLHHLLPQGFSHALSARPTQQIDMDWGNSHHHLTKIMTNMVPSKLFARKTILCIGRDMVPQPKGKRKNSDDNSQTTGALPRIILAMGAEAVEAVTESHLASREVTDYDYIVIREPAHYSPEFAGCTTVHWMWVKECLIASRCLPSPVWPSVAEYSQET